MIAKSSRELLGAVYYSLIVNSAFSALKTASTHALFISNPSILPELISLSNQQQKTLPFASLEWKWKSFHILLPSILLGFQSTQIKNHGVLFRLLCNGVKTQIELHTELQVGLSDGNFFTNEHKFFAWGAACESCNQDFERSFLYRVRLWSWTFPYHTPTLCIMDACHGKWKFNAFVRHQSQSKRHPFSIDESDFYNPT